MQGTALVFPPGFDLGIAMPEYQAPLREMRFLINDVADFDSVRQLPGCEELSSDLVDAILEEAARFSQDVVSPTNVAGDRFGAQWHEGEVTTAPGFKEAYRQLAENGWTAIGQPPEYDGQGLPKLLSSAVAEMLKSANLAFSLCPMLTQGAIDALMTAGSESIKQKYLPKMVAGTWTGTMNLTEPNAGSDLSAVRTRAEPQADGSYRVYGQKIFITWGEHDYTENIIHLVLARTPGAPEGVKGISLFVVPKFLVAADGSLGARNDVYCVSLEHKLGIHGSPTAVMAFGDKEGAVAELVGEENRGLETMFVMMNAARFAVGMEGVAMSERAYQRARDYAKERIQGNELGVRGGPKVPIIKQPDVRRLLMSMRAQTEAMRALAYVVAAQQDMAKRSPDADVRANCQAFVELMIPVVKGWCTETGVEVCSAGVQVHGGMGYIEETGAAQYYRDVRITSIYEGTTAIQANDLIGRKMARENGATLRAVIADMKSFADELEKNTAADLVAVHHRFVAAVDALQVAAIWLLNTYASDIKAAHAGSVPFLNLLGVVAGGWQLFRAAKIAQSRLDEGESDVFYRNKIVTARFYADHVLTRSIGIAESIVAGADGVLALADEEF